MTLSATLRRERALKRLRATIRTIAYATALLALIWAISASAWLACALSTVCYLQNT